MQKQVNRSKWITAAVLTSGILCGFSATRTAHAQIFTVSAYSGNTLTDSANANYNMNLTTYTNSSSAVYSNNVTVLYSTTYDTSAHTLGTLSTPAASGTGNSYSSTASITRDSGLITYDGGAVANAGALSPYSSASGGGAAGYYLFQVPFTLTNFAAGKGYSINGAVHSDNETYDVILDYGTANAKVMTLTGTNIQKTTNDATTDGTFRYNATQTTANAAHTMSFIIYNQAGAMTTSFGFTAATPEPSSLALLATAGVPGLPGVLLLARKKRRRAN